MENKITVNGNNGNNKISVSGSQENQNINVDTNRNSISINAINNNALFYSDKAKEYAEQSKESAEKSEESAKQSQNALSEIKNNEDLKKVSANEENINKVASDIQNVNFVGENIEDITELVTSLENLGDTTNINIVATNIDNINSLAEDIQTVEENKNIVLSQVAVAVEQANKSTENATISTEKAEISINQANISTQKALESKTFSENALIYSTNAKTSENNARDYSETALQQSTIATTQANISITQSNNALNYSKNAKTSEENALIYSNNAKLNADTALENANISEINSINAEIWAEGTDEEVQALGGVHSAKTWAEIGGTTPVLQWGKITGSIGQQADLMQYLNTFESAIDDTASAVNDNYNYIVEVDNKVNNCALKSEIPDTSNFATKSEIPTDYVTTEQAEVVLQTKQDVLTAGENIEIVDNVISAKGGGSGFNLFDTKLSDHILEGEEAKGWALQGTYVYKDGVSGVRDGYPDFYNKVLEHYGNAIETKQGYLSSNVNTVGSLINRQGVLSGFLGTKNVYYATLPEPFNPETNTWEIQFKFVLYNVAVTNGLLCTSVNYDGMLIRTTTAGKLQVHLSGNGTSYNIANGTTGTYVFEVNKPYWLKAKFDGTQYVFSYSTNGIDFIDDITVVSAVALYSTATEYRLGRDHDVNYLRGTIDLNESYIKMGDNTWWQGCNYYEYKEIANGLKFYDINNKSTIDELFNNTGFAWFYGVDTENERIFLPRNVWFDQLTGDSSQVGDLVYAGLPNITGTLSRSASGGDGAFYDISDNANGSSDINSRNMGFDASYSNPIYGNSDTVQPNAVKKLLYICVGNTNVETAVTDIVDVTTTENDTVPLFTGQYFDFAPNNLSWLKGGKQANSGDIYTTAYNELVNCLNGVNKYNLKVIDTADMISGVDYSEYWKVNQSEMYFITPTKLSYGALTGGVLGNGTVLGLTDGSKDYGAYSGGVSSYGTALKGIEEAYGLDLGVEPSTKTKSTDNMSLGITTDVTKSGIIAEESTTAQLYFKVANAVQNLELLNVGEVMEAVSDKISRQDCVAYVTETFRDGASWYRVYSDGWCEQGGRFIISSNNTTVSLLKPYLNVNNYNLQLTCGDTNTDAKVNGVAVYSRTVSDFVIVEGYAGTFYEVEINWEAKGYIS